MWFVYVVEKVGTRVSIELFQGLFDSRVWGIFKSVDRVLRFLKGLVGLRRFNRASYAA